MEYKIKSFGIARDILGAKEVTLKISGTTVGSLREHLSQHYPKLDELRSIFIAVNQKYADDRAELAESDEIVVIPPVSGG